MQPQNPTSAGPANGPLSGIGVVEYGVFHAGTRSAAPGLGEHSREVLLDLDHSE